MKIPFLFSAICIAACLMLCNCTQTLQDRIDRNPAMYAALSGPQKKAVGQGRLLDGMDQDAVYLSWGRPSAIKDITRDGMNYEKWRYTKHMPIVRQDIHIGFDYGYHHGYCGPFYEFGPTIEHVPYTAAVVEFSNGKVSSWERERR
jgi:hypothetical protein